MKQYVYGERLAPKVINIWIIHKLSLLNINIRISDNSILKFNYYEIDYIIIKNNL